MSITAKQVNELREKTGVGLMDCKKILVETDGNIDQAILKLREKGLAKAAKKSDRSTNEGKLFISNTGNEAIILELNCETDFVASNDEFSACGNTLCQHILENKLKTLEDLSSSTLNNGSLTDFLSAYIMKLGENISVKQFKHVSSKYIANYTHMNGKIAVIVGFNNDIDPETAKSIAMHIAATNPSYLNSADVNKDELESEKNIIKTQALQEGKPEAIVDKIVEGRINKYYKEICLLEQPFIMDDKKSVKEILPNANSISEFIRFSLS